MARIIKPLTSLEVKNAKPDNKPYRLYDGNGLYLKIMPHGSKLWRMTYRQVNGKENLLSFGKYPEVSLEQARQRRDEARRLKASGIDPATQRKAEKDAIRQQNQNTFEHLAREWHAKKLPNLSENTSKNIIGRLERNVFPMLGSRPISEITAPEFLSVLRKIEENGKGETARRVRGICSQIMRYAISTARAETDPTLALSDAIQPVRTVHRAAVTDPEKVGELLRLLDNYPGSIVVTSALKAEIAKGGDKVREQ